MLLKLIGEGHKQVFLPNVKLGLKRAILTHSREIGLVLDRKLAQGFQLFLHAEDDLLALFRAE